MNVEICNFISLPHILTINFVDPHKPPKKMLQVGLPETIRVGSSDKEVEYEKFAIAVIIDLDPKKLEDAGLDPKETLHTYGYLRVHSGWVILDNDKVLPDKRDSNFRTHARGKTLVMYRKKRGDDKKFYPRYVPNST